MPSQIESSPADTQPGTAQDTNAQEIIEMVAKAKSLDPAAVTPASNFDDLGIDSLDKINLTFEIEDRFHIAIPDDSLGSLRTVGDVIAGVARLQAEQQASA